MDFSLNSWPYESFFYDLLLSAIILQVEYVYLPPLDCKSLEYIDHIWLIFVHPQRAQYSAKSVLRKHLTVELRLLASTLDGFRSQISFFKSSVLVVMLLITSNRINSWLKMNIDILMPI